MMKRERRIKREMSRMESWREQERDLAEEDSDPYKT